MTQHKNFKHKEIETCNLSKKDIDTLKDRYSVILDCEGEQIKSIKFYKSELLSDLIKGKGEKVMKELMQRTQALAGGMASKLLGKMGLIKQGYEIN